MEEQLYLFEVLVDEINFEDVSGEIPTKKQLIITVSLGSIATLEIRSETLPLKGGEGSNKRHIDFKCGKSYLCFFSPDNLLDALERKSIEVVVCIKGDVQPICSATIPWNESFRDLITESKDVIGLLTPATVTENCILMNNEIKKGNLVLFLRLSCFGTSLQTQFEVNLESGNKQYIFKSPYMMTTFTCTRYGTGESSDFLPVSPMYTITNHRGDTQDKTTPSDQSVSWTALPKSFHPDSSYRSSTQSECLFPEYLNIPPTKTSTLTFDIVSLIGRPEEDKFIDFNTGRRISDPQDKRDSTTHSDDSEGKETIIFFTDSRPATTVERKVGIETSVSAEKLSKSCQCPKTPLVCKHVLDAIKRFEKSHPDLMLYGKKVKYDKILRASNEEKDDSILRLRGGNDKEDLPPFKHKKGKGCYNKKCKMAKKLRSVGVSQLKELTNKPMDIKKSSFCVNILCPENEKQNIGIQVSFSKEEIAFSFDCKNRHCPAAKLLKNFGLGPLAIEKCQGTIYGPVTPPIQYGISQTYGIFDTYGPFGIFSTTDTPFVPDYDEQVDTTECFEYNCKSRNPKAKGEKFVCEECAKKPSRYQIDTTFSSEISFPILAMC
ncbi:hypothetical protein WA026_005098 [Henosepilachna vigintioctopunctata]|uniref:SWIM-type domain-containing protein n=1 Tax=Henosepilachna vigintioctopunctata TaxID=420089 RepID=A0AAW1UW03_9CUCU